MSVRVNLLPKEVEAVSQQRATTKMSVVGVVVAAVLLGGLYMIQVQALADAEAERDDARQRVAQAEQQLAALAEFRELDDRHRARNALLAAAMAEEVSWARILNDLSLAFPSDASLLTLSATADRPEAPVEGDIHVGQRVGDIQANGYSLERYAPGVESVLIDFDGARGFFNSYLQTATVASIGDNQVTNFNGTIDLDEDAYTLRYADGLPPEVAE